MRTREQIRSKFALKMISVFGDEISKEDANFLVGMPTMILTNGIGQSLAFLLSKKTTDKDKVDKDKNIRTFSIIMKWLTDKDFGTGKLKGLTINEKKFLEEIASLEQNEYLKVQEETLKFLYWVKRYARAFQKTEDVKQGESDDSNT